MTTLKDFPNWEWDNYWNHDGEGTPTTFKQTKFRDDVNKWKRDFEAYLRKVKEDCKPQRDINEYNVYHFCQVLLGESEQ